MTSFAKGLSRYHRADAAKVLQRRSQMLGAMGPRVTEISGADMLISGVVRVEE